MAGCVCAYDLSNFGEMMTFSVNKFTKAELVQPRTTVGEHSEASSKWTIPIYQASGKLIFSMAFQFKITLIVLFHLNNFCLVVSNADHWNLRRWSVNKLRDELNRRNIHFDIGMG